MRVFDLLPPEVVYGLRYASIAGFLTATVLLININHKVFNWIFKEKSASYWWIFTFLTLLPLLVVLHIFTLIFGSL